MKGKLAMKRMILLTAALTALVSPSLLPAQVANEGLANQIIAARQKNAALMKQYSWNCRTEVSENGTPKDTRIDTVTFGPDGQPQHTLLNDQSNPLPRGFFRKRMAEKEREKMEEYLKDLRTFLHQYTLPTAGKVINFISTTPIPRPVPAACCNSAAAAWWSPATPSPSPLTRRPGRRAG